MDNLEGNKNHSLGTYHLRRLSNSENSDSDQEKKIDGQERDSARMFRYHQVEPSLRKWGFQ